MFNRLGSRSDFSSPVGDGRASNATSRARSRMRVLLTTASCVAIGSIAALAAGGGGTAKPPAGNGNNNNNPVTVPAIAINPPVAPQMGSSPTPAIGFSITGLVQAVTLTGNASCATAAATPNIGGTVTVNGIVINVPRETIIQFPASTQTWFSALCPQPSTNPSAPPPGAGAYVPFSPALALSTTDSTGGGGSNGVGAGGPRATSPSMEITVTGNILGAGGPGTGPVLNGSDGVYVAALINVSQQSLNSGQGYISFIDYTDGSMYVTTPTGGGGRSTVRLVINDPNGKYGRAQFSPDARFSVDDQNPTITAAESGYPMCVPRSLTAPVDGVGNINAAVDDPFCPQRNRPLTRTVGARVVDATARANGSCRVFADAGLAVAVGRLDLNPPGAGQVFCSGFVMKALRGMPGTGAPGFSATWLANLGAGNDPDPRQMVPFEVGDFITWGGTLAQGVTSASGLAPATTTPDTIWVHTIEANVGVYTQPRTLPSYIKIGQFGIGVEPLPKALLGGAIGGGLESTNRFVAEAGVSDVASVVDFYLNDLVIGAGGGGTIDDRIGDTTVGSDGRPLAVDLVPNRVYSRWLTPESMTGTLTGQTAAGNKAFPSATVNTVQPFGGGLTTQYDGPKLGRARMRAVSVPALTAGGACLTGPGNPPLSRVGCALTASPTRYIRAVVRQLCAPESQLLNAAVPPAATTFIAKTNSPTFFAGTDTVEPNFTGINKIGVGSAVGARAGGAAGVAGTGVLNVAGSSNLTAVGTMPVAAGDGSCLQRAQFANGLFTGQYFAPVGEFILPEKIQTGIPGAPSNFWQMDFLVRGEGGQGGNSGGPQVPQPW
jgi:hypothetical protein